MAFAYLFDGGHVHLSVVQVFNDLWELAEHEISVLVDRVAGKHANPRLPDMGFQVGE